MKNNDSNISDELLSKFLEGKTNEQENDVITEKLSKSDLEIIDIINMYSASEIKKEPKLSDISEIEKNYSFVENILRQKIKNKKPENKKQKRIILYSSFVVAACIAIFLISYFTFPIFNNDKNNFADNKNKKDSVNNRFSNDSLENSQQLLKDNGNLANDKQNKKRFEEENSNIIDTNKNIEKNNLANIEDSLEISTPEINSQGNYGARTFAPKLRLNTPTKYREPISFTSPEEEYCFEWETNADKVVIIITDIFQNKISSSTKTNSTPGQMTKQTHCLKAEDCLKNLEVVDKYDGVEIKGTKIIYGIKSFYQDGKVEFEQESLLLKKKY